MKNVMTALGLVFVSSAAFAAPVTDYLSYRLTNGSVSPLYRTSINCTISSDGLVHIRKITGDIATGSTKKIAWTDVKNEAVLQSLVMEASNGMVVVPKHPLPIGGALATFSGYAGKDSKEFVLKKTVGGVLAATNTSRVSTRLVDFVAVNCTATDSK